MESLSWEELKQLIGKPVWIKKSYWKNGKWVVIWFFDKFKYKNIEDETLYTTDDDNFRKEDQGIRWQAYRQEIEGLPIIPYTFPIIIEH